MLGLEPGSPGKASISPASPPHFEAASHLGSSVSSRTHCIDQTGIKLPKMPSCLFLLSNGTEADGETKAGRWRPPACPPTLGSPVLPYFLSTLGQCIHVAANNGPFRMCRPRRKDLRKTSPLPPSPGVAMSCLPKPVPDFKQLSLFT